MRDLNNVTIVGRLGKKPELKQTTNGKSYIDFSLANAQDYADVKQTYWIDCRAWGRIAEIIAEHCDTGTKIIVQGVLTPNQYQNADGHEVNRTFVNVLEFYFCESKRSGGESNEFETRQQPQQRQQQQQRQQRQQRAQQPQQKYYNRPQVQESVIEPMYESYSAYDYDFDDSAF